MAHTPVVLATEAGGTRPTHSGKVRDIYDRGDNLVIVTTDRISAYDVVMRQGVPNKGRVLHGVTKFWMTHLNVPNHFITDDLAQIGSPFRDDPATFAGRTMEVKKLKPLPVEAIVRGYLTGSGWKEYQTNGTVCGIHLPAGMRENQCFFRPIFTPSTKAAQGHDQNINYDEMIAALGHDGPLASKVLDGSLRLFQQAGERLWNRSVILADTKFEWGLSTNPTDKTLYLIDEALTPDSSRFWPFADYKLDAPISSRDKQILRDWLTQKGWDKESDPPDLDAAVISRLELTYRDIYETITGDKLG